MNLFVKKTHQIQIISQSRVLKMAGGILKLFSFSKLRRYLTFYQDEHKADRIIWFVVETYDVPKICVAVETAVNQ